MRRVLLAALVAVFLSLGVQGCYTKLKSPEPKTGEYSEYGNYNPYYDDYYYYDLYQPYYYNGWYSPYFFGYPSYYGYYYTPWWYDPGYYYHDGGHYYDGRTPSDKDIRRRGRGGREELPPVPGNIYNPPSAPTPNVGGQGYIPPPPQNPPPTNNDNPKEEPKSGKSTRGRR